MMGVSRHTFVDCHAHGLILLAAVAGEILLHFAANQLRTRKTVLDRGSRPHRPRYHANTL